MYRIMILATSHTQNVKELKSKNDYAVNVILNSVSEKIPILFGTIKIASEI
jgi:hypothetical protein